MHKLWPHSVKNSSTSLKTTNSNTKTTIADNKTKESQSSQNHSNNQNDKNGNPDTSINIDPLQTQDEFNQNSNLKTPMCLINELVKYNKVILSLFIFFK